MLPSFFYLTSHFLLVVAAALWLLLRQGLTIYRPGEPEAHCVDEVGLNGGEIHLPLKSWDERHVSSRPANSVILNKTRLLTALHTPMGVCVIHHHWQKA